MPAPSFGLYNAKGHSIILGALILGDQIADSFLNIRADEPSFTVVKGADGSITRVNTNNTLFHVEYTVKRPSKDNALLSAYHNADLIVDGGAGVSSLLIKDPQGSDYLTSLKAWIAGWPDAPRGKDGGGDVTWIFDCQVLPGGFILGGNQL